MTVEVKYRSLSKELAIRCDQYLTNDLKDYDFAQVIRELFNICHSQEYQIHELNEQIKEMKKGRYQ